MDDRLGHAISLRIVQGDDMDDEIILAMAICELLGQPKSAKDVEKAIEKVRERLEKARQPPREAKVTYGHRRD